MSQEHAAPSLPEFLQSRLCNGDHPPSREDLRALGQAIGGRLPFRTLHELLWQVNQLGVGTLEIRHWTSQGMRITVHHTDDSKWNLLGEAARAFEAGFLEGAIAKLLDRNPGLEVTAQRVNDFPVGHAASQFAISLQSVDPEEKWR